MTNQIIRTETWARGEAGPRLMVDVQHDETVIVSVQILHVMLRDLGWKQVNP